MNVPNFCDHPSCFESYDMIKYVRFSNDRVLFVKVRLHGPNHKNIVDETVSMNPDLKPISAGTINVIVLDADKEWFIYERGSTSAKLHSMKDDDDAIKKELGDGFSYNFDLFYR